MKKIKRKRYILKNINFPLFLFATHCTAIKSAIFLTAESHIFFIMLRGLEMKAVRFTGGFTLTVFILASVFTTSFLLRVSKYICYFLIPVGFLMWMYEGITKESFYSYTLSILDGIFVLRRLRDLFYINAFPENN